MERSELARRIGGRIRDRRRQLRISQEELAFKAEMHPSYLGCIERGEKCPTVDTVYKLSEALGVPLSSIISVEGENEQIAQSEARISTALATVGADKLDSLVEIIERLAGLIE